MGAFLDKPETTKHTEKGLTPFKTAYALSSMQGWRINMEDAHFVTCNVPNMPGSVLAAVFDGHGGTTVSIESARQFVDVFMSCKDFTTAVAEKSADKYGMLLVDTLLELDKKMYNDNENLRRGTDRSGSTAVVCLVVENHIVVANCGDSRFILVKEDGSITSTKDHKPTDPEERQRIRDAGGFVEMGRVCGNLAVSRSLGDYEYKGDMSDLSQHKITAMADITVHDRKAGDKFIVLACDGIWDVLSNEQVAAFVTFYLQRHRTPDQIAEMLMDYCLELGSKDNMSVVIVLLPGAPVPVSTLKPPDNLEADREAYEKMIVEERQELRAKLAEVAEASRQQAIDKNSATNAQSQSTESASMDDHEDEDESEPSNRETGDFQAELTPEQAEQKLLDQAGRQGRRSSEVGLTGQEEA